MAIIHFEVGINSRPNPSNIEVLNPTYVVFLMVARIEESTTKEDPEVIEGTGSL